jgi:hypothetical protein
MKTVVSVTQQSVISEIENVLDTYPDQRYQKAFAIPDLRKELIAFVLKRLAPEQVSRSKTEKDYQLPGNPLDQYLHLQNLIHQGICSIIQERSDRITHDVCEVGQLSCEPCHWFG